MKTVIRRHGRVYHVFRMLRVAQAIKAVHPEEEVFIECLEEHKNVLALAPSVKWKNPQHPFAVAERANSDPKLHRPGGPLYDRVIDVDSDGPLDVRWVASGLSFWEWVIDECGAQGIPMSGQLYGQPWPVIEVALPIVRPPEYVLLAPVSAESNPAEINANALAEWAEKAFPGVQQYWATSGRNFGPGRAPAVYSGIEGLAAMIRAAKAVVTVKGIVAGLAQARDRDGRLAKILVLVTDAAKPAPGPKPPRRASALSLPGPLLDLGEAAEAVGTFPNTTAILEPQSDGSLKELTPHPAD